MTTSNEHNNAHAVPQGWKLVPVEPTRAMWAAVNKLDDEMAAGSYDGKGCSIEQAWNCMLDFAPDAPALAATPAPAPAQGEPFGHFRAEPFGWTDCAKDDEGAIALYERPQEVGLTASQFDLICQAIDKADTATMEGDYMLDSDDCINVVRVMQALFDVTKPAQEVGLTDEEIEAIAQKHMSTVGDHWSNEEAIRERHAEDFARAIIAALRAKGQS